jgi:hypothetical protein
MSSLTFPYSTPATVMGYVTSGGGEGLRCPAAAASGFVVLDGEVPHARVTKVHVLEQGVAPRVEAAEQSGGKVAEAARVAPSGDSDGQAHSVAVQCAVQVLGPLQQVLLHERVTPARPVWMLSRQGRVVVV